MPVPTERKTKSATPRATPCHCSPSAARLMSFSSVTGKSSAAWSSSPKRRPSRPATFSVTCSVPSAATTPGTPTTTTVHQRGVEGSRVQQGRAQAGDRVRRSLGVRAGQLEILARADRALEIAERATDEACAEVEPEHQRSLGHGLEVDGSVAGAVRPARGFAHEPGVEQGTQREGDRRLGDPRAARDLGARDRCAFADRLEHGPLVQRPEQRRRRSAGSGHLVKDINPRGSEFLRLDSVLPE